ncbi:hypothetical protein V9T40_006475 [Parthenolecanium corni]|uniref:Vacuole membrane protein 1 n=1 Tax=Parthenolecanium corni TaxID=536013 RepID=A0AAN9TK46_9HEMI
MTPPGPLSNRVKPGFSSVKKTESFIYRLVNKMTSNGDTLKRRTVSPETKQQQLNGTECQHEIDDLKEKLKRDRESLVLWRRPFRTLNYFFKELIIVTYAFVNRLLAYKKLVFLTCLVTIFVLISLNTSGPHQSMLKRLYKEGGWCLYWLGLGVLSSVGLGTGLHTFLLYLGPHIASVTLAAYECGSLNFPEPPYPDQIVCPEEESSAWATSLWNIMQKVKIESVMWGAGTALGELPPYFMARAARLSGYDPDDEEDLKEFEELQKKSEQDPDSMTFVEKTKWFMERIVKKVGFFGILACASIPNPLFDLAGITCGHFLIPFWTFFGATLLGKAVIKMMIQVLFVIIAFNEVLIETALDYVGVIPFVGVHLQPLLVQFLQNQKKRLHEKGATHSNPSKLATLFDIFVLIMVCYFVLSIVNSMAQSYHKRINKEQLKSKTKKNLLQ